MTVIGTRLNGRYRIEDRIGAGGMSTVYRAFDETLERQVAIKILHGHISEDAPSLERFRREARTVAQLSHPHVVMVIDAGEDEGHPYIVFEHIRGETVKDRIKREGQLPVAEAVAYAIEIGRGLQAAHERSLVHRDVKPQNVLIDDEGRAKVTDFGIALGLESNQLTGAGKVIGTTDYVSPEQAMGQEVTGQSDVYSLGIVLYEMLTGKVPFSGESHVSVAMKHIHEGMPDVRSARPEVSAVLASLIERATAKDQRARYASMADFVKDLEEVLEYESARSGGATGEATAILSQLPGAATRPTRRKRILLAIMYVLIVAAVATLAALLINGEDQQKEPPAQGDLTAISLGSRDAFDYDPPPGDGSERTEAVPLAIDGDPTTAWESERYDTPDFGNIKKGVGLYLDAGRPIVARGVRIVTPKDGWSVRFYASRDRVPDELSGWTLIGSGEVDSTRKTFGLDTAGKPARYYLVWITSLTEGATGGSSAAISEVRLLG